MVFSSIIFLCLYLPLVLILYYIMPTGIRNIILLAVSLLFYAWGEPKYVFVMIGSVLFGYICGLLIEKYNKNRIMARILLIISLIGNLGALGFFKYTDFFIKICNSIAQSNISLLGLALPIGISFYTFQILSYTIDIYKGKTKAEKNLIDFGMYVCLFPQLIAGPIVKYTDIAPEIRGRKENLQDFYYGLLRFIAGLGKKVILSNQIGLLQSEISNASDTLSMGTAWIGALAYTFQIYYDFSGYSDMAIGIGKILGFHFPENFNYPYKADSITDFWHRWHMTLSGWFREYVYIPLGGNRCKRARHIFNMLVVWSLTGFWHGADWNFILWGLFYFALLVTEKLFLLKYTERFPKIIRHIYAMFFIIIGWVIFSAEDLPQLGVYLKNMFGSNGLFDSWTLYYIRSYGLLFVVLILGATQLPNKIAARLINKLNRTRIHKLICPAAKLTYMVAILSISLVLLIGDSYNPFLYFRF